MQSKFSNNSTTCVFIIAAMARSSLIVALFATSADAFAVLPGQRVFSQRAAVISEAAKNAADISNEYRAKKNAETHVKSPVLVRGGSAVAMKPKPLPVASGIATKPITVAEVEQLQANW